ncbi:hypothetical protein [Streptomyces sp. NBC_01264]|uniref:hypothetical protein n=1 Tax=Streptomyces sp. NBC_01264 TaxID=2903804 RepID=UPI0022568678|nr:hypothetical protein [Streptomyces sp. NBC_01264]MCX4782088.1 hypothetical protein [Streptomyces sp. NBC_01264]
MSQTALTTRSQDWPHQVRKPGNHDWERTATRWLGELLPARYAGYATLKRSPVLLARHAQLQVEHETRAVRVALETGRAQLPSLGVTEGVIETSIRMYAAELQQLSRLARAIRLVGDALASGTARAR